MSIPSMFEGEADFVRSIARANEGLMPLMRWLDELHQSEKPKATAAAFILLGQRLVEHNDCGHDQAMAEMSALYRMIVDGGLDTILQDNASD